MLRAEGDGDRALKYALGGFTALAGDEGAGPASAVREQALAAVRRLWSQLGKSLPAGVFVRAFQGRTDLLRALIVGPDDTPYEKRIFIFDLSLPSAYPRAESWDSTRAAKLPRLPALSTLTSTWSG